MQTLHRHKLHRKANFKIIARKAAPDCLVAKVKFKSTELILIYWAGWSSATGTIHLANHKVWTHRHKRGRPTENEAEFKHKSERTWTRTYAMLRWLGLKRRRLRVDAVVLFRTTLSIKVAWFILSYYGWIHFRRAVRGILDQICGLGLVVFETVNVNNLMT